MISKYNNHAKKKKIKTSFLTRNCYLKQWNETGRQPADLHPSHFVSTHRICLITTLSNQNIFIISLYIFTFVSISLILCKLTEFLVLTAILEKNSHFCENKTRISICDYMVCLCTSLWNRILYFWKCPPRWYLTISFKSDYLGMRANAKITSFPHLVCASTSLWWQAVCISLIPFPDDRKFHFLANVLPH